LARHGTGRAACTGSGHALSIGPVVLANRAVNNVVNEAVVGTLEASRARSIPCHELVDEVDEVAVVMA